MITSILVSGVILTLYLFSDLIFDQMKILMKDEDEKRRQHVVTSFVIAGSLGLFIAGFWFVAIFNIITIFILQSLEKWFDENFMEEEE